MSKRKENITKQKHIKLPKKNNKKPIADTT